jgi:dihydrofolate reductase
MGDGRITCYIAASVDGFIADADGGVAWLDAFDGDPGGAADYESFFASVDCLAIGSTTYEQILGFGEWPYGDRPTYVFTGRQLPRATDAVEFVDGPVSTVAAELEARHEHVWLVGGGRLIRSFLREGRIDELRLHVAPILLGDGVPLFGAGGDRRDLELTGTRRYDGGIVELRYDVLD